MTAVSLMASSGVYDLGTVRDPPKNFGPLQSLRSLATSGLWAKIMSTLADAHDAAVQMIDTSIVRVRTDHGAG